jgi:hypothetical protein
MTFPFLRRRPIMSGLLIALIGLSGCGRPDQNNAAAPAASAVPSERPTSAPQSSRQPTSSPALPPTSAPTAAAATPSSAAPAGASAIEQQLIGYWDGRLQNEPNDKALAFIFAPNATTGWFMGPDSGQLGTYRFLEEDLLETDMADVDRDYRVMRWRVRLSADANEATLEQVEGEGYRIQLTRMTDASLPMPPEGFPGYERPPVTPTQIARPIAPLPSTFAAYAEPGGLFQLSVPEGWAFDSVAPAETAPWLEYRWRPPIDDGASEIFVAVANVQDSAYPAVAFDQVLQFKFSGMNLYEDKKNFNMGDAQLISRIYQTAEGVSIQADVIGIHQPPYFVVYGVQLPEKHYPAAKDVSSAVIESMDFDPTVKMPQLGIR